MSRVSLSRRDAEAIAQLCEQRHPGWLAGQQAAVERLRSALAPKPKRVAATKAREAVKATKRATKREETSAIYGQADLREGGLCAACRGPFSIFDPPELDHARGRGRVRQALSNVWMLHKSCHRLRHAAYPSRDHWLDRWADHCRRHGYAAEAFDADAKRESRALVQAAAAVTKGAH